MATWTDELKAEVIKKYTSQDPNPETSTEIVKAIAEEYEDLTANGIRMVLIKAEVYVAKTPSAKSSSGSTGGGRVSKAGAQKALADAISAAGKEPDMAIIEKLTGKAAQYLADVIKSDD